MLSEQARELFKEIRRANAEDGAAFDLAEERFQAGQAGALTGEPSGLRYETRVISGLRTIIARPELRVSGREMIFLHGGAFALMSPETHRRFAGHIAKACRADVYIPAYSLAPECPFPAAFEEVAVYIRAFTEAEGPEGRSVILSGDSAGGGLALSAAMKMRDDGLPLPSCLILLCPWLDLALESPSVVRNQGKDIILKGYKLERFAALYIGGRAGLKDPIASPIYGRVDGLPPIYLQGAEYDLLLGDALRLQAKARQAGRPVHFDFFPLMPHSFQFFAGRIPEAGAAISQIGSYLDEALGSS